MATASPHRRSSPSGGGRPCGDGRLVRAPAALPRARHARAAPAVPPCSTPTGSPGPTPCGAPGSSATGPAARSSPSPTCRCPSATTSTRLRRRAGRATAAPSRSRCPPAEARRLAGPRRGADPARSRDGHPPGRARSGPRVPARRRRAVRAGREAAPADAAGLPSRRRCAISRSWPAGPRRDTGSCSGAGRPRRSGSTTSRAGSSAGCRPTHRSASTPSDRSVGTPTGSASATPAAVGVRCLLWVVTAAQGPDGHLVAFHRGLRLCRDRDGFGQQGDTLVGPGTPRAPARHADQAGEPGAAGARAPGGSPAVDTFNADDNRWMIAVNEAMGFVPIWHIEGWELDL